MDFLDSYKQYSVDIGVSLVQLWYSFSAQSGVGGDDFELHFNRMMSSWRIAKNSGKRPAQSCMSNVQAPLYECAATRFAQIACRGLGIQSIPRKQYRAIQYRAIHNRGD